MSAPVEAWLIAALLALAWLVPFALWLLGVLP